MTLFTGSLVSYKTTILGAIPAALVIARAAGLEVSDETVVAVITVCFSIAALFARDANVTSQGGKVESVGDTEHPAVMEKIPSVEAPK